jgi:acyl carrier protein
MSVAQATTRHIQKLLANRGAPAAITEEMNLQTELGLTSLNMISLLTGLCAELGIDIYALSDLDIGRMHQVKDVVLILEDAGGRGHVELGGVAR